MYHPCREFPATATGRSRRSTTRPATGFNARRRSLQVAGQHGREIERNQIHTKRPGGNWRYTAARWPEPKKGLIGTRKRRHKPRPVFVHGTQEAGSRERSRSCTLDAPRRATGRHKIRRKITPVAFWGSLKSFG